MEINRDSITAVYPGTFDPITLGHIDIIQRSTHLFDHVVVGIAESTHKVRTLFSAQERLRIMNDALKEKCTTRELSRIETVTFDTLLIEFAENFNASVIVRGLRNNTDFEFEHQLAGINSYLSRNIETLFLIAKDRHQYVSSTFVKEVARLDGDVSHFVSDNVVAELQKKFKEEN